MVPASHHSIDLGIEDIKVLLPVESVKLFFVL